MADEFNQNNIQPNADGNVETGRLASESGTASAEAERVTSESGTASAETGRLASESGTASAEAGRVTSGGAGVLGDLVAQAKYESGTAGLLDAKGNIPREKLTKTRRGVATAGGILGVIQSVLLGGALVWTAISIILMFFGIGDLGPLFSNEANMATLGLAGLMGFFLYIILGMMVIAVMAIGITFFVLTITNTVYTLKASRYPKGIFAVSGRAIAIIIEYFIFTAIFAFVAFFAISGNVSVVAGVVFAVIAAIFLAMAILTIVDKSACKKAFNELSSEDQKLARAYAKEQSRKRRANRV